MYFNLLNCYFYKSLFSETVYNHSSVSFTIARVRVLHNSKTYKCMSHHSSLILRHPHTSRSVYQYSSSPWITWIGLLGLLCKSIIQLQLNKCPTYFILLFPLLLLNVFMIVLFMDMNGWEYLVFHFSLVWRRHTVPSHLAL